jgi:hypothetical protein
VAHIIHATSKRCGSKNGSARLNDWRFASVVLSKERSSMPVARSDRDARGLDLLIPVDHEPSVSSLRVLPYGARFHCAGAYRQALQCPFVGMSVLRDCGAAGRAREGCADELAASVLH